MKVSSSQKHRGRWGTNLCTNMLELTNLLCANEHFSFHEGGLSGAESSGALHQCDQPAIGGDQGERRHLTLLLGGTV